MFRRALIAVALLVVAESAAADESAIEPEAKAHLDKGLELYEKKDYAAALLELEAGYAIDPKPEILYARAQAERLAGLCEKAIEHYEGFLATKPEPEREAAARANLARCKDELAAKAPPPAPAPSPAPAPAPTPPAAPPPRPAPARRPAKPAPTPEPAPWYHDVFGDVLLGTGVLAAGVGGFFVVTSYSAEARAEDAGQAPSGESYQYHVDRLTRAERQRTTGVVVGAVGLGLIGGAVLRFALREPARPALGLWLGPTGGGAGFGRAF